MRCIACGAAIFFAPVSGGRQIPFDVNPVRFVPDINGPEKYLLDDGTVLRGCVPEGDEPDIHTGWITHWATCTNNDFFRRRQPHHD